MDLGIWGKLLLLWVIAIILMQVLVWEDLGFTVLILFVAMIWHTARILKANSNLNKAKANLRTAEANLKASEANLEKAKSAATQPASYQTCPKCSAPTASGANFCRNCGFKLS